MAYAARSSLHLNEFQSTVIFKADLDKKDARKHHYNAYERPFST
ncbi:hypothetical protein [Paenibacillus polymyxa]|nr:hypothetical protein [Paenibacillus polymyxa]